MSILYRYSPEQKLDWFGYGPWIHEPDEFVFEYSRFFCKIERVVKHQFHSTMGGYLTVCICLSKLSNLDKKSLSIIDTTVHGGITHSFVEDKKFFIQFDAAHDQDVIPSFHMNYYTYKNFPKNHTYKDIHFMINECKKLIDQIKKQND